MLEQTSNHIFFFFQTNESNPYPPGVVMFTPNSNGHLNLNVEFQPHNESTHPRAVVVGGRNKQSSLNFAIVSPGSANGSGSQMTGRSDWPTRRDGRLAERPSIPGASSNSSVKRHTRVSFFVVIFLRLIVSYSLQRCTVKWNSWF